MGAKQPGLDVAEDGVNDREELSSVLAIALYHRKVFQIVAKCRNLPLVGAIGTIFMSITLS
jgi:hypothetical protein